MCFALVKMNTAVNACGDAALRQTSRPGVTSKTHQSHSCFSQHIFEVTAESKVCLNICASWIWICDLNSVRNTPGRLCACSLLPCTLQIAQTFHSSRMPIMQKGKPSREECEKVLGEAHRGERSFPSTLECRGMINCSGTLENFVIFAGQI